MKKSKISINNLIKNQIKILPYPPLSKIIHEHSDCHGTNSSWHWSNHFYFLQCLLIKFNIPLYLFSSFSFYLPVVCYSHINHDLIFSYPFWFHKIWNSATYYQNFWLLNLFYSFFLRSKWMTYCDRCIMFLNKKQT